MESSILKKEALSISPSKKNTAPLNEAYQTGEKEREKNLLKLLFLILELELPRRIGNEYLTGSSEWIKLGQEKKEEVALVSAYASGSLKLIKVKLALRAN